MKIKFRGTLAAMTETQAIQGRNGVINKATAYVVPITFDPDTGDPTAGEFEDALPVECLNETINQAAVLAAGTEVSVNAYLTGRTTQQQDGTIKSFMSLRLVSMQPVFQQTAMAEQSQQPQAQLIYAQQPPQYAQPFPPMGR